MAEEEAGQSPNIAKDGKVDLVALALALGHAGALDPRAAAYLDEQTKMSREQTKVAIAQERVLQLQAEDLKREDKLRHWSFLIRHFSDVIKVTFELALAALALGIVVAIAAAAWSAHNDNSVVIEAFSVPPDMAARGLTGEVIATKLLDKLAVLQKQTTSARSATSYANNWGDDFKVQIPDTGVSIGEFNRYLRAWLGHQTHISGNIYRNGSGIAVTARAGSDSSPTFSGTESDLDALIQKAAEAVYRSTQPYRYAIYLFNTNRVKEAEPILETLAADGSPQDRAWAYIGLANDDVGRGDFAQWRAAMQHVLNVRPDFVMAYVIRSGVEAGLQHDEASLAAGRKAISLGSRHSDADVSEQAGAFLTLAAESNTAGELGDYNSQIAFDRAVEREPEFNGFVENAHESDAAIFASLHDARAARQTIAELPPSNNPQTILSRNVTRILCEVLLGHWSVILDKRAALESDLARLGASEAFISERSIRPYAALALAEAGDLRGAHALVDTTPADCVVCLRLRGQIDAIEKNWGGAAYWFQRAVHDAPSIPFAATDFGQMLLKKGDYNGAIAKFMRANRLGPHFADPLEMWGEALMLKNRSDLALAKFEEAGRYAPNWGRLHLKWGEALMWSGDGHEAQKQFAIASKLDLTAADRKELARMSAKHG